jgi:uncharacterized coiled-coil DUF342 family protein
MDEETRKVMEAGFGILADLIRETNAELHDLRAELGATRTELSDRIDRVRDDLGAKLGETNGRLDNLIVIAGEQSRGLRKDLDDLSARVEALEKKAS